MKKSTFYRLYDFYWYLTLFWFFENWEYYFKIDHYAIKVLTYFKHLLTIFVFNKKCMVPIFVKKIMKDLYFLYNTLCYINWMFELDAQLSVIYVGLRKQIRREALPVMKGKLYYEFNENIWIYIFIKLNFMCQINIVDYRLWKWKVW